MEGFAKIAKASYKNPQVKSIIKDIREHFAKQDNPWPLRHSLYKEMAGVKANYIFNILLEQRGFVVYYDKTKKDFMIKAGKLAKKYASVSK